MTQEEIRTEIKKYFQIYELVGPKTYKKHGERAWKFFSDNALHSLLITRVNLNRKITVNTWYWGGKFSQRGLRTNVQNMFRQLTKALKLYLSGHVLGEAFDYDVQGMEAEEVREWIVANHHLYPMKIRLEHKKNGKPITWVHQDSIFEPHNPKVYLFNV